MDDAEEPGPSGMPPAGPRLAGEPEMSQHHSVAAAVLAATLAFALGGCAAGPTPPAWVPATPETPGSPAASPPAPSSAPPAATASSTPSPSAPVATPVATTAAAEPGLADEEWAVIATPWAIERLPSADPPPAVDAAEAERIVREQYAGDRPLVWAGLVGYGSPPRVGWMVVLGTAPGQACNLHPGLLERALEGGIVDATTGELFFSMTCG